MYYLSSDEEELEGNRISMSVERRCLRDHSNVLEIPSKAYVKY